MKVVAVCPWRNEVAIGTTPYVPAGIICDCINMAGNREGLGVRIDGEAVTLAVPGTDALGMNPCARAAQRSGIVPLAARGILDFRFQASAGFGDPDRFRPFSASVWLPRGDTALIFSRQQSDLLRELASPATLTAIRLIESCLGDWDIFAVPLSPLPYWAVKWEDDDSRTVFIDPTLALFGVFPIMHNSHWQPIATAIISAAGIADAVTAAGAIVKNGEVITYDNISSSTRYAVLIALVAAATSLQDRQVNIVVEFPFLVQERLIEESRRVTHANWVFGQ